MNTEVYIENYRLDISEDLSALLTFALDDVKDFSSRSTTWSKTIVLPGTANNNKLFGHIFQIGQNNFYNPSQDNVGYNFNASKSAECIIFQDQMQTFKGVLRLLQINVTNGRPEYEVSVFGKIAQLNVILSGRFLEDLDFSAYNQVYNHTNIVNSWDNPGGSGLYYPLIDYGTYSAAKHDWDIRTFRPALYVKEYIDKMFEAANFRYESALFDTPRFKHLIVPHNQKKLYRLTSQFVSADGAQPYGTNGEGDFLRQDTGDPGLDIDNNTVKFTNLTIASNFTNLGGFGSAFQYNQPDSISVRIRWRFKGTYGGSEQADDFISGIAKNRGAPTYSTADFINYQTVPVGNPDVNNFDFQGDFLTQLNQNDYIELFGEFLGGPPGVDCIVRLLEGYLIIEGVSATLVEAAPGDTISVNDTIPKNIRQIDFLVSLVKLFNLYVWEDKYDPSLIYIKPYVDYYSINTTNSINWTYKLNRNKTVKIKPMSELNARKYEFKYKSDSDYYNDLYRKRYNQGYGDYVYDSEFEFTDQTKSFELIFSATPLVGYVGEEKIYPTIFKRTGPDSAPVEELTDSNIRIMQSQKISGVASWAIKNVSTTLVSVTTYGYAGHFDDPDAPSDDLNFGALRELFFTLLTGALNVTQFNVYWSSYMAEITDKDSKLLTASFYLTPKDIYDLDFSKYIYLDGVLFRLNKIKDYNASKPKECVCELLKVGYTNYTEEPGGASTEIPYFLLWDEMQVMLHDSPDEKIKHA